jgi:MFS transporter, DHA1 family, solute carrier family 18 (vesicular amine transporter), member 1/2
MSEQHQRVAASQRSFRLLPFVLFGVFTLDTLLYGIVIPFLPGRMLALGATQVVVGILFASYAIGLVVATPVSGWLTDRFGGQRILVLGLLLLLISTLVFAFSSTLPLLFVARTLQGVAASIPWTAGLAVIASEYSGSQRYQQFTQVFSATSIGTLVGPSVGGLLYTWRGFQAPFITMAALILLESIVIFIVFIPEWASAGSRRAGSKPKPASQPTDAVSSPIGENKGSNIRELLENRQFIEALLMTSAGALLLALLDPTLPVLLADRYGLAPLSIGLIFGAMTLLFILVQGLVVALLKSYSSAAAIFFGLTMGPLSLLLVAVSITLIHALVALAMLAFSFAFLLTPALEYLTQTAQQVADHKRLAKRLEALNGALRGEAPDPGSIEAVPYGTLYASYNLAYAAGMLVGPVLAGAAITTLGLTSGLVLTGGTLMVMFSPLILRTLRSTRRQSTKDEQKHQPPAEDLPAPVLALATQRLSTRASVELLDDVEVVEIVKTEEIVEIEEIEILSREELSSAEYVPGSDFRIYSE